MSQLCSVVRNSNNLKQGAKENSPFRRMDITPKKKEHKFYTLDCAVGGFDLALFSIFENLHISADHLETQFPKNRQFRPGGCARIACATKFSFSKKSQKINIFCWKLEDTFIINERTIYRKFVIFLFHIHFYFLKMGKTVFELYKVKL